jgi:hypothetical protein
VNRRSRDRRSAIGFLGVLCSVLCVLVAGQASGQFAMPDAKEMSGIPRPVDDLPNGAISVRLVRGQLPNNITNHPVELHAGGKVLTVKTDDAGRAQFNEVPPGSTVKATAEVDGEHLESREFPAPTRGGIRLMLVATDKSKPASPRPDAAPAVTGPLTIGNQSRIVMQPNDEVVEVFYLLDISNAAATPVNPPQPFVFDLPSDASGAAIMEGSSPQAKVAGRRVTVDGPFPPGHTFVQVAFALPGEGGTIDIAPRFPAKAEQLAIVVKKVGDTTLQSPQIRDQREVPAENDVFIAANGGEVQAGQPIELTLSGFPHHSAAPRYLSLSLAAIIALAGVWAASRPPEHEAARTGERKQLIVRRDKLFNELARLENDHRRGKVDDRRHAGRREELVASLEQVYGALDGYDVGPEPASPPRWDTRGGGPAPADRAGVA